MLLVAQTQAHKHMHRKAGRHGLTPKASELGNVRYATVQVGKEHLQRSMAVVLKPDCTVSSSTGLITTASTQTQSTKTAYCTSEASSMS